MTAAPWTCPRCGAGNAADWFRDVYLKCEGCGARLFWSDAFSLGEMVALHARGPKADARAQETLKGG